MRGRAVTRLLTGTAVAIVVAGAANLAVAFAGDANRNFQQSGTIGSGGVLLTGGGVAPAILDTSHGPAHLTLKFGVHRYAGPGHKPYNTAIDLDLTLRVRHVLRIAGVNDPGFAQGDPGFPATAGHPAFDDAYLGSLALAKTAPLHLVQSSAISTQSFHVHFDALPNDTHADVVAGIIHTYSFSVAIPRCGYYDIETGAFQPNTPSSPSSGSGGGTTSCTCPPPHSQPSTHVQGGGDYFSVLTRVFVRAVSSVCSSPSPTPTATVAPTSTPSPSPSENVLGITAGVPEAGAGPGYAPAIVSLGARDTTANLYIGLLLLGGGLVMIAMTNGWRRALAPTRRSR